MKYLEQFREMWEVRWFRVQIVIGLLLTAIAVPVTYWISDTTPPYEYVVENSYIRPPDPDDGGQITAVWGVKPITRTCPASSRRQIFDPHSGIILAAYDPVPAIETTKIGDTQIVKTFTLPARVLPYDMTLGYRSQLCFQCNPYQTYGRALCVPTPTLYFRVRKPDEKPAEDK